MLSQFGLPDGTIKELLDYFKSREEIERVVVFGSRAKGAYTNGSDIDLAIWINEGNVANIAAELEELPTPYKFDVINYKTLTHEGMKFSIDNEGIDFYKK